MQMESKKLEKKIRDWANDLSFKLPDGSAPPENYFALLTATPHRRRLWEVLIESVQPRQKVEHMRKQIVVAKLRDRKKVSGKNDPTLASDRIEFWREQNLLENQLKGKRNETINLERNILTKASDLLFEICKLAELLKLYEECSEKALALRLFTKRENSMVESLDRILQKTSGGDGFSEQSTSCKEKSAHFLIDELLSAGCENPFHDGHDCRLIAKLEELRESGMSEPHVWEEVLKRKRSLLLEFAQFLEELASNERNILREKEAEVERIVKVSMTQVKQRVTEKSLQVMVNSMEGQALDWEVEKLLQTVSEGSFAKGCHKEDEGLSPAGRRECFVESEEGVKRLRKCLNAVGVRRYETFLREERKRLEEEMGRWGIGERKEEVKEREEEEVIQKTFPAVNSIVEEIDAERSEQTKLYAEILRIHSNLMRAIQSSREEPEVGSKARALENAEKLKCAPGKLTDALMETPLDAFRTVESSSGGLLFECESLSHCLMRYGGELRQFFSAMLIIPRGDPQVILLEAERRRKMLAEIRKVIRDREELAQQQKEIQLRMGSIKLDKELCESNFKESDAILWNVLGRSEELLRRTDFIEKILKNWVEQPYRLMIREAVV